MRESRLHLATYDEQNYRGLESIAHQFERQFATSVNVVFLLGTNAEHGKPGEYDLMRSALDHSHLPWFSMIGDHGVHARSFEPIIGPSA